MAEHAPGAPEASWSAAPPAGWIPAPPPEARKRRGTVGWDILLGLNLIVIALLLLGSVALYLLSPGWGAVETEATEDSTLLSWITLIWMLFAFGVVPILWVAGTRVAPLEGALRYLALDRPWPALAHGAGYAMLLLGLVLLLSLALDALGIEMGDPESDARFHGLTWPLVFAMAAVAGFAEEVFFRGLLQKWIGVWGQAGLFGLFHIAAGLVPFFVTGLIGLLFGYLVKRGRSLWLVITAHFLYNLVLLSFFMFSTGDAASSSSSSSLPPFIP